MYQYAFRLMPKQLKTTLLAVTILGLVTMNIATLVSDSFHTAAFETLGTTLGYTVGSQLTDKMLSRSSVVNRKNDVAVATRELSRKNQILKKTIDKKSVVINKFS